MKTPSIKRHIPSPNQIMRFHVLLLLAMCGAAAATHAACLARCADPSIVKGDAASAPASTAW